jgi:DNA uptake protein ComE-like DNA-binding protein
MGAPRYLMVAALSALLAAPVIAHAKSSSSSAAQLAASTQSDTSKSGSSTSSRQGSVIDLNSASAEELDALPGIGKKRAAAIIAHRPYKAKDELVERKIIPQSVYSQIKDKIVARGGSTTGSTGSSSPRSSTTKKTQ